MEIVALEAEGGDQKFLGQLGFMRQAALPSSESFPPQELEGAGEAGRLHFTLSRFPHLCLSGALCGFQACLTLSPWTFIPALTQLPGVTTHSPRLF